MNLPLVADPVRTHCPYCALQCAMTLSVGADGAVEVQPRDFPTNRGGLCQKGWTAADVLSTPDRLTTPLVRGSDGELAPATWEEALGLVAERLLGIQAEHGRDAVGVFGGGGLTNEKAYQLGKFARVVLGTRHIDYNGRFCMSSAAAAGNRAFGIDRGLPFPVEDIDHAGAVLLLGSNVADTMPPFVQHLSAARERRRAGGRGPARLGDGRADRRGLRVAPPGAPGHGSPTPVGNSPRPGGRGMDRRGLPGRAYDGLGRRTPLGRRMVAGACRRDHRRGRG